MFFSISIIFPMVLGDLRWPLSACSGLGQGLGSQPENGPWSEQWKQQLLATRPVDSDEGPGPLAWQNRIPTKVESSETSKVFIKRKKVVCVDRHTGRLGVPALHPRGSLNYVYGVFQMGFPLTSRLICLVHSPHLVDLRILPCVHMCLLTKTDFTEKVYE